MSSETLKHHANPQQPFFFFFIFVQQAFPARPSPVSAERLVRLTIETSADVLDYTMRRR